jgi:hypothetical protein
MKLISLLLGAGLLVPAFGQNGVIAEGTVPGKGFQFYWQSRLEPPSPPMANSLGYGSGINDKTGNIFRVMIDRVNRIYFGYEVRVEVLMQSNTYRMTFHPLDLSPKVMESIHLDNPSTWNKRDVGTAAARPVNPVKDAPDIVHTLDVVAVDLLVNPETRQKIVDYVVLQEPSRGWSFDWPIRREFGYTPGTARDFTVEDAGLKLVAPSLSINGHFEVSDPLEFSGTTIRMYVPNRGIYLMSLTPKAGFHKAGEVRGTSLTFTSGADRFVIASASAIVTGDTPFNLYVMEQPGWKPANASGSPRVLFGVPDAPGPSGQQRDPRIGEWRQDRDSPNPLGLYQIFEELSGGMMRYHLAENLALANRLYVDYRCDGNFYPVRDNRGAPTDMSQSCNIVDAHTVVSRARRDPAQGSGGKTADLREGEGTATISNDGKRYTVVFEQKDHDGKSIQTIKRTYTRNAENCLNAREELFRECQARTTPARN